MKRLFAIMALATLTALAGCKSEETHSVEWYRSPENKAAFDAKIAECKNNPGEMKDTPNCINAFKAFELNFLQGGTYKKTVEPEFGFKKK